MVYILTGDKKGDTYEYIFNVIKFYFDLVEGFHRGFKSRVNRPKPTVQEYFRAIREQQVITDYHIDRLGVGKTPSKKRVKRKTSNDQLFQICSKYSDYSSKVDYLFEIAKF